MRLFEAVLQQCFVSHGDKASLSLSLSLFLVRQQATLKQCHPENDIQLDGWYLRWHRATVASPEPPQMTKDEATEALRFNLSPASLEEASKAQKAAVYNAEKCFCKSFLLYQMCWHVCALQLWTKEELQKVKRSGAKPCPSRPKAKSKTQAEDDLAETPDEDIPLVTLGRRGKKRGRDATAPTNEQLFSKKKQSLPIIPDENAMFIPGCEDEEKILPPEPEKTKKPGSKKSGPKKSGPKKSGPKNSSKQKSSKPAVGTASAPPVLDTSSASSAVASSTPEPATSVTATPVVLSSSTPEPATSVPATPAAVKKPTVKRHQGGKNKGEQKRKEEETPDDNKDQSLQKEKEKGTAENQDQSKDTREEKGTKVDQKKDEEEILNERVEVKKMQKDKSLSLTGDVEVLPETSSARPLSSSSSTIAISPFFFQLGDDASILKGVVTTSLDSSLISLLLAEMRAKIPIGPATYRLPDAFSQLATAPVPIPGDIETRLRNFVAKKLKLSPLSASTKYKGVYLSLLLFAFKE